MTRLLPAVAACLVLVALLVSRPSAAVPQDVVLRAADFTALHGNWARATDPNAADQSMLTSEDRGWSSRPAPLASPDDYVEAQFSAAAHTPYRVWLRLRATGDSKWNDSVWVQFDQAADLNGQPVFRTGTTDGLLVNLESCYACGVHGWGWQDRAWWTGQTPVVQFEAAGLHTIRIQTREDGVMLDQVVLSPVSFLDTAPGAERDDQVIVPRPVPTVGGASDTATVAAASAAGGSDLPVLTWNLNISRQDDEGARAEMREIAALSPRPLVLVLEEARGSLYSTYLDELQAQTGQAWAGVFQGHCAAGAWDESSGSCRTLQDEGVVILTSLQLSDKDSKLLPYADCWHSARAAVHAAIEVNGTTVQVYGAHLQTGTCSDVVTARLNSIAALQMWISRSPGPALVAGDFNETPGSPEISGAAGMASAFIDAWTVNPTSAAGATYPVPAPDKRIDYWFIDRSGKVQATAASVVTSAGESDHYPLRVQLRLQQ